MKVSGIESIGVVIDADDAAAASRWQSIRAMLRNIGYAHVDSDPDLKGTVVHADGLPAVGVWIMPDNSLGGALEDFVARLIPSGDMLWPKAQNCVASIEPEARLFTNESKAVMHTWLAWQQEPGVLMGSALKRQYLDAGSLHATDFT